MPGGVLTRELFWHSRSDHVLFVACSTALTEALQVCNAGLLISEPMGMLLINKRMLEAYIITADVVDFFFEDTGMDGIGDVYSTQKSSLNFLAVTQRSIFR
jgi:hypothetical protein